MKIRERTNLTDIAVRKLVSEPNRQLEVWDAKVPGFGVRVSPAGTKSFVLMYRLAGRACRMTLGRYPALGLGDARGLAQKALSEVAAGRDPQRPRTSSGALPIEDGAGQTAAGHFPQCVERFVLMHCKEHNRVSTARETERLLRTEFVSVLRKKNLAEIRKADVVAVLNGIVARGSPSAANHALAAIRKLFNWAVDQDLLTVSPCAGVKRPAKPASRDRVLTVDELAEVWHAAVELGYPFGTIVQLLALTAQRRGEVASMRWQDLNLSDATWTLPREVTKNKQPHLIPLPDMAVDLLRTLPHFDGVYVFPARNKPGQPYSGFSKGKRRLNAIVHFENWTLHDLRRTAATGMARSGVAPYVVERILNHVSGTFGGVAGIYNRFGYLPEMRDALAEWQRHLIKITN